MNDFIAVALAVVFVVAAFVHSTNNGVTKLLISGCATLLAMVVFFLGVRFYPYLAESSGGFLRPSMGMNLAICGIAAMAVYILSLLIVGAIIKALFGDDGVLEFFADGIPGGILSLFPSIVAIFFFFTCVRVVGTLKELNYTASLSQGNIEQLERKIPPYPFSSRLRNGIEVLSPVAWALDLADPFSNRRNRHAAAFAMMSQSGSLQTYLSTLPEAAELSENISIRGLKDEPSIASALEKQERLSLVLDPALREVAALPEISVALRDTRLRPVLDGFASTLKPMYRESPSAPES